MTTENKPRCPKCSSTNLLIERRPNGNAACTYCDWKGPYAECFNKPQPADGFDKVDRALEMRVIDWLQWAEFPEMPDTKGIHELALELIYKRKKQIEELEAELKAQNEQLTQKGQDLCSQNGNLLMQIEELTAQLETSKKYGANRAQAQLELQKQIEESAKMLIKAGEMMKRGTSAQVEALKEQIVQLTKYISEIKEANALKDEAFKLSKEAFDWLTKENQALREEVERLRKHLDPDNYLK